MSATNRGAKRVDADFYPTPVSVIQNFLQHHKIKDGTILEPCAGNGNFIKALREFGYDNYIVVNELRDHEINNLYIYLFFSIDQINNVKNPTIQVAVIKDIIQTVNADNIFTPL